MKTLLTRLTLLVIATIVAVLAVHLLLILVHLLRANRNLAKLVAGLEAIRANTTPLDQDLTTINGAASTLKNRLVTVDEHVRGIIQVVHG